MEASKPKWGEMMAKAAVPAAGAEFSLAFIADQDEASKVEGGWETKLASGVLVYNGDLGDASYSLKMGAEATLVTARGDKSGRGAEYSALELFDGKLLTMCDRTGNCDEIAITPEGGLAIQPLMGEGDKEVAFTMGDGSKPKPLKVEWATPKDGKLFVGSTGKERTNDDGTVAHEGEMWCKFMSPSTYAIEHVDTRPLYGALRKAAHCEQGAGYMIHEGGRWSDEHQMWLFMPRKLSREKYDETIDASKCVNLMCACPDAPAADGSDVALQEYLEFYEQRGCVPPRRSIRGRATQPARVLPPSNARRSTPAPCLLACCGCAVRLPLRAGHQGLPHLCDSHRGVARQRRLDLCDRHRSARQRPDGGAQIWHQPQV